MYYIGVTQNLEKRLDEHNKGRSKFTKKYRQWDVVYSEEFEDKNQAYKRELYLKHPKGYIEKLRIINRIKGEFA